MYRQHSFEEKLAVVKAFMSGCGLRDICRSRRLSYHLVYDWLRRYKCDGEAGLRTRLRQSRLSPAEKSSIVRDYLERSVPLRELCERHGVSRSALREWADQVRRSGYGSLYASKRRGRPPKEDMGRSRKKTYEEMTELERLRYDNMVLRAENALLKKLKALAEEEEAIDGLRPDHPLGLLLRLGKMARSVFYYHKKRMQGEDKHAKEEELIKSIFHEHKGRYGYRRITMEMHNRGYKINHKTVQKLMTEMNLKSQIRKVRYRSYKGEVGKIAPNIIDRDFKATAPNRKWATDVTQINICGEKLYLSPIIDMYNGEIISYNISRSPNMAQVQDMLDKAFRRHKNLKGLVLHSDQGWLYQLYPYRKKLQDHGIIQSMSRKGNCLDNAVAENFFGIMKSELLYPNHFKSPQAFMKALEEYIFYYNNKRIKLRLNGKSPVQYRTLYHIT